MRANWEGGFNEKGIAIIATKYEDGEIYDLGYTFLGSIVLRYLESKSDSQISIGFGLKY